MKFVLSRILFLLVGAFLIVTKKNVEANTQLRTEAQIYEQFLKYVNQEQTHSDKEEFKDIIELLAFPQYLWRNYGTQFNTEREGLACIMCRAVVKTVIKLRKEGKTDEEVIDIASDICTLVGIQPANVCRGAVALNTPIMLYIIDNIPELTPENFCGVLHQSDNPNSCSFKDDRYDWHIDIPPKPAGNRQIFHTTKETNTTFKILHLTDIHYDPAYEAFGLADCNEPTCCRVGQAERETARKSVHGVYDDGAIKGRVQSDWENNYYLDLKYAELVRAIREKGEGQSQNNVSDGSKAGYWGDYRSCDTPWWAVEDGIDFITENHNSFEYVYYTGDTIDHGVWETSRELITKSITKLTEKFKQAFGNRPVYLAVGNHESQPTNQFSSDKVPTAELSTAWLYELMWEQWKQWLPAKAEETLKKGGYYTALPKPGLRVIALNSNLCYTLNWWIHYDPEYAKEQMNWFVKVLSQAEANNEKVHILSHSPAGGSNCLAAYSRAYKRIIERFSDIIMAEYNGDVHGDEFKIFYHRDTHQPIHSAWTGGSLTPYSNLNYNFKIFQIDTFSYEVVDFETWIYNLTEANLTPHQRPRWFLEYNFKKKFNVSSLRPKDLDVLVERLVTVDQDFLLNDYQQIRRKSSDISGPCGDGCARRSISFFSVSEIYDYNKLDELYSKYLEYKNTIQKN